MAAERGPTLTAVASMASASPWSSRATRRLMQANVPTRTAAGRGQGADGLGVHLDRREQDKAHAHCYVPSICTVACLVLSIHKAHSATRLTRGGSQAQRVHCRQHCFF